MVTLHTGVANAQRWEYFEDEQNAAPAEPHEEELEQPDLRWKPRPLAMAVTLGAGSPTGFLGGELSYAAPVWLAWHVGVGVGMKGPQVTVGVRPRLILGAIAIGPEVSYSSGKFTDPPMIFDAHTSYESWTPAHWINGGGFLEYRSQGGFLFRATFGGGVTLNDASDCYDDISVSCEGKRASVGYVGLHFGYAFPANPKRKP